ncbi:hypothetical protein [Sphingomonas sp. GB1N7]|uniref:hypothetical protein n=1 Tax=Parasphingomonas caseinilytica TaxID=3096158 RepID=UPI002FC8A5C1
MGRFARLVAARGDANVVLVSTPDDGTEFSREVRLTESKIVKAGLGLTSLRLRWFYQNFSEDFLKPAVLAGELRLPAEDGLEAFVDADDIAEVAAAVLTDATHDAANYDLTGPRLMGFADVARDLSKAIGRDIRYDAVTPATYVAEQLAAGVPMEWASLSCELYGQIASRKLETTADDIARVLGRPPRDFTEFAFEAASRGAWS